MLICKVRHRPLAERKKECSAVRTVFHHTEYKAENAGEVLNLSVLNFEVQLQAANKVYHKPAI